MLPERGGAIPFVEYGLCHALRAHDRAKLGRPGAQLPKFMPCPRAIRALHSSGGGGIEAAVAWLADHEADADLDTPLLVPKVSR